MSALWQCMNGASEEMRNSRTGRISVKAEGSQGMCFVRSDMKRPYKTEAKYTMCVRYGYI